MLCTERVSSGEQEEEVPGKNDSDMIITASDGVKRSCLQIYAVYLHSGA